MTRIIRIFAGYCIRLTPARSAAAYAHQVHRKHMIWGSKLLSLIYFIPYKYLKYPVFFTSQLSIIGIIPNSLHDYAAPIWARS
jgi:hypothetical protein